METYKSKNKNIFGTSMCIDKCSDDFYGIYWAGEDLNLGYDVNNCGTKDAVYHRLGRLVALENNHLKTANSDFLIEEYQKNKDIYIELMERLRQDGAKAVLSESESL